MSKQVSEELQQLPEINRIRWHKRRELYPRSLAAGVHLSAMEPEPDLVDTLRKLYREEILRIDSERNAFRPQ